MWRAAAARKSSLSALLAGSRSPARRLSAAAMAASASPQAAAAGRTASAPRVRLPIPPGHVGKLKAAPKRAKHLLLQLEKELLDRARPVPRVQPGDAVEMVLKDWRTAKPRTITGVVEGVHRKNSWTASLRLISIVGDERLHYAFPLHSPAIQSLQVTQPAFIHKGAKRVRRARLYYLANWPPGRLRPGLSKEARMVEAKDKAQRAAVREKDKETKLKEKKRKAAAKKAKAA